MKNLTLTILCLLFQFESLSQVYTATKTKPLNLSKAIKRDIKFLWDYPTDQSLVSNAVIDLRLDVFSPTTLDLKSIQVLVNGKQMGNKSDVIELTWKSNDRANDKKLSVSNRISLNEGNNTILVKIIEKNGNTLESSIMCMLAPERTIASKTIIWKSPDNYDYEGKPIRWNKPELPISLIAVGIHNIDKNKLKIILNGETKSFPVSGKVENVGGDSRISTSVTFKDTMNINTLSLTYVDGDKQWQSDKLKIRYYLGIRPDLYILSIGTQTNLQYTVKDARDIANLFSNQGGKDGNRLFGSVVVDTLLGESASASEMAGKIEELKTKLNNGSLKKDDLLLVYISSHGFLEPGTQDLRIQGNDYRPDRSKSTSVSYKEQIINPLNEMACKKLLLIDACHSGAKANPVDINYAMENLYKSKGITAISSSRKEEMSYEDDAWQNAAFTKAIKLALAGGKADKNNNGIVTISELFNYLSLEVPAMVMEVMKKSQHPMKNSDELGDVGIYIVN